MKRSERSEAKPRGEMESHNTGYRPSAAKIVQANEVRQLTPGTTKPSWYQRKKKELPPALPGEPVNWGKIVLRLRGQGYSLASIARYCGCSREHLYTLQRGEDGAEPPYSVGIHLLNLNQIADGNERRARQAACNHNWRFVAHGHNDSLYECTLCGMIDER